MREVGSAANPRLKALRKLLQSSQERKRTGLSLLDGIHLVTAYCDNVGMPQQVAVSRSGLAEPEIAALLAKMPCVEPLVLSDSLFKQLSPVTTPTGILAAVKTPRPQPVPAALDACVMLEDIQDPGNLGSILRSAAAAGMRHVLLSAHSAHAWSPRVLRAGMGAHFVINIYEFSKLVEAARAFPGRVIATSQQASRSVCDADLTGGIALLFGNEGAGLSRELLSVAHEVVAIPMPGKVESINVAAAAAVCLFERVRQTRVRSKR